MIKTIKIIFVGTLLGVLLTTGFVKTAYADLIFIPQEEETEENTEGEETETGKLSADAKAVIAVVIVVAVGAAVSLVVLKKKSAMAPVIG